MPGNTALGRHKIADLEHFAFVTLGGGFVQLYLLLVLRAGGNSAHSRSRSLQKSRALLFSPSLIVATAFFVRLAFLYLTVHGQPIPADNRYAIGGEVGNIAASLAAGKGFSSPLGIDSGPSAWTTPIFPLLLALFFKIFGVFTFKASIAIRLLNIIFSSITCYPLFLLGRRLFGEAAGAAAGWFWALLPKAIYFSVIWVWDTSLSAMVLSLCLLATYAIEENPDAKTWAGWGALWGFATLVNAAILSVFPGSLLFAALRVRRRGGRWLSLAALATTAFALTLSPWIIRNQIVFHGPVLLRSNFGLELWLGNNPEVPVTWSWWLHPTESAEQRAEFLQLGEVAYMQEKKAAAIEFIKTHPADTLRFQCHRFMETWTGFGEPFLDIWSGAKALLRAELLLNYSLPLLMLFGLLLARRRKPIESIPLINVMALFPAVYYFTHTTSRYRHPIDPIVSLLAAYAVVSMARYARERLLSPRHDEPTEAIPLT